VSVGEIKLVEVRERLLIGNDRAAVLNRARFDAAGVLTVNLMAAPGAGKTSLIVRSIAALAGRARVGVIEGDVAGHVDTATVLAAGARDAVQINTGGACHLEAGMVARALDDLEATGLDLLFVENVGNLVCPTHWALGEHLKVCLVGAAEGHDKPVKYPEIFSTADTIVLTKLDLIELVDFDRARFVESVRVLNTHAPIFEVSCRSGAGIDAWATWLLEQRARLLGNPIVHDPAATPPAG